MSSDEPGTKACIRTGQALLERVRDLVAEVLADQRPLVAAPGREHDPDKQVLVVLPAVVHERQYGVARQLFIGCVEQQSGRLAEVGNLLEQCFFATEVLHDQRGADPRVGGDSAQRDRAVRLARERLPGGAEDRSPARIGHVVLTSTGTGSGRRTGISMTRPAAPTAAIPAITNTIRYADSAGAT